MKALVIILALLVILLGGYIAATKFSNTTDITDNDMATTTDETMMDDVVIEESNPVIGISADGHEIRAYHYGDGEKELLFVGGIHGGYSWNTVLVAHELMSYLEENPKAIPSGVKVTVIPVLNPDGLNKITGTTTEHFKVADVPTSEEKTIPGRFNGNNVDLNRNFDCDWQSNGTWRSREVSGGESVFSESESKAIRDYVSKNKPSAVVVWYSALGGVFSSNCHNGILDETLTITNLYADASGYKAFKEFDFYTITGDMVNWLAKENIPAISVLLSTHSDVEWDKNKKGIEALLEYYAR
jgi:hypothetical protein